MRPAPLLRTTLLLATLAAAPLPADGQRDTARRDTTGRGAWMRAARDADGGGSHGGDLTPALWHTVIYAERDDAHWMQVVLLFRTQPPQRDTTAPRPKVSPDSVRAMMRRRGPVERALDSARADAGDAGRTFHGNVRNGVVFGAEVDEVGREVHVLGRRLPYAQRDSTLVVMVDRADGIGGPPVLAGTAWVGATLPDEAWGSSRFEGGQVVMTFPVRREQHLWARLSESPAVRTFLGPEPRWPGERAYAQADSLRSRRAASRARPDVFTGPSPWPAIRRERIARLLPAAMREANVDAWIVMLRENANDPLALHVGGENAGAPSAVLLFRAGDRVRSVMLSGFGEAIALRELALHDSVVVYEGGVAGLERAIAERVAAADPARVAVNSGGGGIADGLSWTQRTGLERALGPALASRLVPSEPLVQAWLAIKLPAEVEAMRRAAALTVRLEEEAYATIVPGVTRDSDLARFLKRRMRELGVEDGWSPAQNPSVNSGLDRGHSHASDRVIQPGDVIQTDFGIKVHGVWVTDIQRFAYVLRPGESAPPREVQERWAKARDGGRAAFDAMRPGVTGARVDSAQRVVMARGGSLPVPWGTGHGVGYWAHDAGPGLNRRETRPLAAGMTFAFDGFFAWAPAGGSPAWGQGTKTISVEEMAVITPTGAEYLVPPQRELILVGRGAGRP